MILSARGAETHVDNVRTELHRVVKGGKIRLLLCNRVFLIAENLHQKQLRVRCNACHFAAFSCGDAGNVGSVVGMLVADCFVNFGIIPDIRNFFRVIIHAPARNYCVEQLKGCYYVNILF